MSKLATKLTELRDQPDEELRQALVRTRDELFRLHLGQYTNQVTSSASLTTKRRDIARIMTILNGRAAGIETQAQKQASAAGADAGSKPAKTAKASKAPKAKTTKKAKS
jgi:large subunit ribosomal protein L29